VNFRGLVDVHPKMKALPNQRRPIQVGRRVNRGNSIENVIGYLPKGTHPKGPEGSVHGETSHLSDSRGFPPGMGVSLFKGDPKPKTGEQAARLSIRPSAPL